jgi:colicin import membrane protein
METLTAQLNTEKRKELKWSRVILLSLILHLAVFSLVLFVPDAVPTRKISSATIYEVNLVEMPVEKASKEVGTSRVKRDQGVPVSAKEAFAAKRIKQPERKEKPVVIGKRAVKTKREKTKKVEEKRKPRVSPSKLIDEAVSKIEKKVKTKEKDHLNQAIAKLETKAQAHEKTGSGGGDAVSGITMRLYQLEVEERIKSNWSYAVGPETSKSLKDLEAIVVVGVKNNGSITRTSLKKKSSSARFDDSVLKAVKRSDPLPPFPEGYRKTNDEIEITFNLSDL